MQKVRLQLVERRQRVGLRQVLVFELALKLVLCLRVSSLAAKKLSSMQQTKFATCKLAHKKSFPQAASLVRQRWALAWARVLVVLSVVPLVLAQLLAASNSLTLLATWARLTIQQQVLATKLASVRLLKLPQNLAPTCQRQS
jgi:hypothetical protein